MDTEHEIFKILDSPEQEGFIRSKSPSVFIFPGGEGDSAFFCVDDYTVLVNGGSLERPWFWRLIRHHCRLDCMISTHISSNSLTGLNSLFTRKLEERNIKLPTDCTSDEFKKLSRHLISPDMGLFFVNLPKNLPVDVERAEKEFAVVQNTMKLTKSLNMMVRPLFNSKPEPMTLFMKAGIGKLQLYPLLPDHASKELKHIHEKYGVSDKLSDEDKLMSDLASICCLLVWHPESPDQRIVRVLFPGNAKQGKILEALDKLKQLDFLRVPQPTPASLKAAKKKPLPTAKATSASLSVAAKKATTRNVSSAPPVRAAAAARTTAPAADKKHAAPATNRPASARPKPTAAKPPPPSTKTSKRPSTVPATSAAASRKPAAKAPAADKPKAAAARGAKPTTTTSTTSAAAKTSSRPASAKPSATSAASKSASPTKAAPRQSVASRSAAAAAAAKKTTAAAKATSKKPAAKPATTNTNTTAAQKKAAPGKTKTPTTTTTATEVKKKSEAAAKATPKKDEAKKDAAAGKKEVAAKAAVKEVEKRPTPEGGDGVSRADMFVEQTTAVEKPAEKQQDEAAKQQKEDTKNNNNKVVDEDKSCGDYLSLDKKATGEKAAGDEKKEDEPVVDAKKQEQQYEVDDEDGLVNKNAAAGTDTTTTTTSVATSNNHNVVGNDDTVIVTDELLTPTTNNFVPSNEQQQQQAVIEEDGMPEHSSSSILPAAVVVPQQQAPPASIELEKVNTAADQHHQELALNPFLPTKASPQADAQSAKPLAGDDAAKTSVASTPQQQQFNEETPMSCSSAAFDEVASGKAAAVETPSLADTAVVNESYLEQQLKEQQHDDEATMMRQQQQEQLDNHDFKFDEQQQQQIVTDDIVKSPLHDEKLPVGDEKKDEVDAADVQSRSISSSLATTPTRSEMQLPVQSPATTAAGDNAQDKPLTETKLFDSTTATVPPHYSDVSPTAPLTHNSPSSPHGGATEQRDHSETREEQRAETNNNMSATTNNNNNTALASDNPFLLDFASASAPDASFQLEPSKPDPQMPALSLNKTTTSSSAAANKRRANTAAAGDKKPAGNTTTSYVDLTYVPHQGHHDFVGKNFFKQVKSRYYVLSGMEEEGGEKLLDSMLDGVTSWNDKEKMKVVVIPTKDSASLRTWFEKKYDDLEAADINIVGSDCKVFMHNETIPACKIEL